MIITEDKLEGLIKELERKGYDKLAKYIKHETNEQEMFDLEEDDDIIRTKVIYVQNAIAHVRILEKFGSFEFMDDEEDIYIKEKNGKYSIISISKTILDGVLFSLYLIQINDTTLQPNLA